MASTSSSSRSSSPVAAVAENTCQEETPVAGPSKVEPETSDAQDGIDRLLQRHRNELMYELRRMQHGSRPVTGQDNRQNVEDFFNRALQQNSSDVLPPGLEPPRPENVMVEVNALVERRPVSSILQSAGFRQSLENAVRGAISRVSSPVPNRNTTQASATASLSGAGALSNSSSQPQAAEARANSPQPTPRHTLHNRHPVPRPRSRQPSPQVQERQDQPTIPPPPPLPTAEETRAQAWLQQQPLQELAGEPAQQAAIWENLGQTYRESLVMEISELVQQHLVSTSLESNFRNRLEGLMRDRVIESGTEGRRVQQFIQSLPRTVSHQRNDFSDLGIVPPMQQDNLSDDVSVISATAAVTVHNAQANAAMGREINSLKAQIEQLKNMMRMSFDLQLDIQRAIRQEVAAAVTGALQEAGTLPSQPTTARPVAEGHCLICLDGHVDSVLYQCGHMCVCHTCGLQLKSRGAHCPMCRAPIRDIIRAYKTGQE